MKKDVTQQLAEAMSQILEKAASTQNATLFHGQGGLLSGQGIERDVITAMVRPYGIGAHLPLLGTIFENPSYATILGIMEDSDDRPTEPCEDAPAGYTKGCELTAQFGLVRKDTRTIDIYKSMLLKNRGDMTDLQLRGALLGMSGTKPANMTDQGVLDILTKSEMINAAVRAERTLSQDLWQGTGAGAQFAGLDNLITTGIVDWRSNAACPALDSDIKDFNYADINGTVADIAEYLSMLDFYLRHNSMTMGLDPATWAIAMRPGLWFELSAIWPCRYMTNRCQTAAGVNAMVINDNVNVSLRDQMRNGMFIDINGHRYPVIVDTGIYEQNWVNDAQNLGEGEYASSIYFVPLTITGNFPVTYREYLDYREADANRSLLRNTEVFWTDGGIYGWSVSETKGWCYQLALRTEQRIILRTPQLAGKLQNVKYAPLQHLRSPYPGDTYFKDGGVSLRDSDTIYASYR